MKKSEVSNEQDTPVQIDSGSTPDKADDAQSVVSGDVGDRLVPVSEAIRYRKRAQTAEQELSDLKGQFQDVNVELEQARQAVSQLERRQAIDEILTDAETVDLGVARLLTEAAVTMMDEPDIRMAIEDLRRHKPYLFHKRRSDASVMPARHRDGPGYRAEEAEEAAERAAVSGDRRDLLKYLRLRRKP